MYHLPEIIWIILTYFWFLQRDAMSNILKLDIGKNVFVCNVFLTLRLDISFLCIRYKINLLIKTFFWKVFIWWTSRRIKIFNIYLINFLMLSKWFIRIYTKNEVSYTDTDTCFAQSNTKNEIYFVMGRDHV